MVYLDNVDYSVFNIRNIYFTFVDFKYSPLKCKVSFNRFSNKAFEFLVNEKATLDLSNGSINFYAEDKDGEKWNGNLLITKSIGDFKSELKSKLNNRSNN
ncbi:hypothetical protein [Clostridium sp.]|jgi:hypothetical protein|uniref:hypothetical protein n=1 Tax=Clostridium sp. TaxID=1506 RepID=UPI003EEBA317